MVFDAIFGGIPSFVANRLRTAALRALGVRIGSSSVFWGKPHLFGSGPIEQRLTIGEYCGFNAGCVFELEAPITIGDHVAVGHDVMFLTGSSAAGRANPDADRGPAPIVIGNGAWLGARTTVLPGVTIGASSVIAAGLVVAKDVPENTLLTGGPAISLARWR